MQIVVLIFAVLHQVKSVDFDPQREEQGLQLRQQYDELKAVIRSGQDDWRVWLQMAITLQQLDHNFPDGGQRVPEAIAAYYKAIQLTDRTDMLCLAYGNLGVLQMGAGHGQDALESYALAMEAVNRDTTENCGTGAGIIYNRGKALTMLGKKKEAEKSFSQAVEAARGTDAGVYAKALASTKKYTKQLEAEVLFVVNLLAGFVGLDDRPIFVSERDAVWMQKEIGSMDECWLNFAAYTALEQQISNSENQTFTEETRQHAWFHLERANKLQRQFIQFETNKDQLTLNILKQIFGSKFGPTGYPSRLPIFVVGVPRSGSTLVEQILASHSHVFGAGEDTAFAPLLKELMEAMSSVGGPEQQLSALERIGKKYVDNMKALVPEHYKKQFGKPTRIVDKMLHNAWNLGHVYLTVPNSCVIHAMRHPMDTGFSCYVQPFEGRGTPWAWEQLEIANQIKLTFEIMDHWKKMIPGWILDVRYEELIGDPEVVSRRILSHCGLDWEDGVLQFWETERTIGTASMSQVRVPLYSTAVGKWKKYEDKLFPMKNAMQDLILMYESVNLTKQDIKEEL
eukprot:TRINITY_DN11992_c0_g1_i1.p1 TRINITY_DN11992_c0_g1~~TRINITY_DN11992_c0_g1_i1.p1  ORF type:complete len:567 (-),score=104.88 TRINITY_DN11992_c0_g1_i1:506-2206(-)